MKLVCFVLLIIFWIVGYAVKEVILDLRPLLSQNKLLVSLAVGHKLKALQVCILLYEIGSLLHQCLGIKISVALNCES